MINLTQREKEKLNTVAEIENIKNKYGLKGLIEVLDSSLEKNEDLKKVGMALTNEYYKREEIEEVFEKMDLDSYAFKVMEILDKYDNQYPTDRDLK